MSTNINILLFDIIKHILSYLPFDIFQHILSYDNRFVVRNGEIIEIKKIKKMDFRYKILMNISLKEYDAIDDITFLYLYIGKNKDYFITYRNYEIQIQTLIYHQNTITSIESYSVQIE